MREANPGVRLCIDAVPLLVRSAGVKNYLYHWVVCLQKLGGVSVELFPYLREPGQLNHEQSVLDRGPTLLRLGLLHMLNRLPNQAADWILRGTDLFHTCKLLNPPTNARLTATIHDVTCFLMPEMHTPANVKADRYFTERILKRADGLIAVSECTRRDAVRWLGLDPERIEVIHHGVADSYFGVTAEEVAGVRRSYTLERPYVLFVGTIEPRKNLGRLLDAYAALPGDLRGEFDLVVAGPTGWSSAETLARLQAGAPGVRYLGYVPEPLLPPLVAGATVFAYVSLYEGFGFPVAQAMAAGVPVITSNVSALPEVAGEAAELVDPLSVASIRATLCRVLTSPSRRALLSAAARERSARFRWDHCARQSLRFFERVVGAV